MSIETYEDYLARLKAEGRPLPGEEPAPGIVETQQDYLARIAAEAAAAEAKAVTAPANKGSK